MAIAVRYAETEPQPPPRRESRVGLVGGLFFAVAVFGLTLALLTIL
ncbi:hypothetical protein ACFODL_17560 [Phenylobacterium terrae]|uniref:Uncharacterized protein n=1 Tax=Phenylobacterium terrae TaxID=2665495 RepID=A0ABW4N4V8_9CAUL